MLCEAVPAKRNVVASGQVDVMRVGEEIAGRLMSQAPQDLCYGDAKGTPDGGGAAFAAQKGIRHRRPSTLRPGAGATGGLVVGNLQGSLK
jgi:hypothetical protein